MKRERTKGFITGMLVMALAIGMIGTAAATVGQRTANLDYKDIKITLNGQAVTPTDAKGNVVEPFSIDGTIYLPVRAVGNALGLDVKWDGATNTAALTKTEAADDKGSSAGKDSTGSQYTAFTDASWCPDFGAIFSLKPTYYNNNGTSAMRTYSVPSFDTIEEYTQILQDEGFVYDAEFSKMANAQGGTAMVYVKNGSTSQSVTIDVSSTGELEIFFLVK